MRGTLYPPAAATVSSLTARLVLRFNTNRRRSSKQPSSKLFIAKYLVSEDGTEATEAVLGRGCGQGAKFKCVGRYERTDCCLGMAAFVMQHNKEGDVVSS